MTRVLSILSICLSLSLRLVLLLTRENETSRGIYRVKFDPGDEKEEEEEEAAPSRFSL